MSNKLQYISQGATIEDQLYNIHQALDHGCDWIQMRFKDPKSPNQLLQLAEATKMLCNEYLATFIINDSVELAQQVAADGVHLGLTDMNTAEARTILGQSSIIGGTANTVEDIISHAANGCDYVGVGPFQFTKTKDKLSPILGLEGYKSIVDQLKMQNITIPLYAIGGIKLDDVNDIISTGIHGIAVSGLITECESKNKLITQINEKLYGYVLI